MRKLITDIEQAKVSNEECAAAFKAKGDMLFVCGCGHPECTVARPNYRSEFLVNEETEYRIGGGTARVLPVGRYCVTSIKGGHESASCRVVNLDTEEHYGMYFEHGAPSVDWSGCEPIAKS